MRAPLLALLLSLASAGCAQAQPQAACPVPKPMRFEVTGEIKRTGLGFTQGLEFHKGALWESTGNVFGTSRIQRIDLATGKTTTVQDSGNAYFGEGMTVFGDRIWQLTYKEGRVFQRTLEGKALREFKNPREGWGITHDATRLIISDGSDRLFFYRPSDFANTGSVQVRGPGGGINGLNELEYVNGAVFANIFTTWQIVKISPQTGCVTAVADLAGLRGRMSPAELARLDAESNFVLNGIAWNPATGLFTLTGKYWANLYTGRFIEQP
jgi:glutamine cyclotransferase